MVALLVRRLLDNTAPPADSSASAHHAATMTTKRHQRPSGSPFACLLHPVLRPGPPPHHSICETLERPHRSGALTARRAAAADHRFLPAGAVRWDFTPTRWRPLIEEVSVLSRPNPPRPAQGAAARPPTLPGGRGSSLSRPIADEAACGRGRSGDGAAGRVADPHARERAVPCSHPAAHQFLSKGDNGNELREPPSIPACHQHLPVRASGRPPPSDRGIVAPGSDPGSDRVLACSACPYYPGVYPSANRKLPPYAGPPYQLR